MGDILSNVLPEQRLARLVAATLREPDAEIAISGLLDGLIGLVGASHSLLAVLDEEVGDLTVRYGSGRDWETVAQNRHLPLDMGLKEGIVGWVAATGTSVVAGNVREDPKYRALFDSTLSEMAVPVRDISGRLRAVLNVESDHEHAFSDSDQTIIESAATICASLIDRIDQNRREEALIQIGNSLDTVMDEADLIQQVIEIAEQTLRLHSCSIFLFDANNRQIVLRGTIGRLKDQIGLLTYDKGEGFTGWVAQNGKPILLDDPQTDTRWRGKYVEIPSEQIASFLAVPIMFRNHIHGVIRALRRRSDNPFVDNRFTSMDERLLQAIAEQVASGLENIQIMSKIVRSERMIAWGELSAKSSHMIGNRIFAIKGDVNELGFLASEPVLDVESIRSLQKSLSVNVMRVEEILNDFRDFVSATQIQKQPIDINTLVKETVEEVFPKRSPIQLVLTLNELPPVLADDRRLRRAISELIENSLHHITDGQLSVTTELTSDDEYVRIVIADSGPGIEPDRKETIFQPFYSGRAKGMGLGLSIVKGILEAHGGNATEEGVLGQGARFVLVLPA